eukprot:TRINITY_DN30727_c0_g2_i7.p1 TRINITY_DN30727_c0_g2~~TRINITY_DN30727_c0_g2_i7.p1  ORF type:complete len:466 (+),score=66.07 TRINITY_DN30727_c0_g2_i7:242-1639(+)
MMHVTFALPNGTIASKDVPAGCQELRVTEGVCGAVYPPGTQVEIWSNSSGQWAPGRVTGREGSQMKVDFNDPVTGEPKAKNIQCGHPMLRFAPSTSGGAAPSLTVLVDQQEAILEPGHRQGPRMGRLSSNALHGPNPGQFLADGGEHAADFSSDGSPKPCLPLKEEASSVAKDLVLQAMNMAYGVAREPRDVLDKDWPGVNGVDPLLQLFSVSDKGAIPQLFVNLTVEAQSALQRDPTLVKVEPPVKVYGDIHGQFRDMLLMLHHYGWPGYQGQTVVFNGDWADRGAHQLEVVALVLALKACYPEKVILTRGNHEDPAISMHGGEAGFYHVCLQHVGQQVFDTIHRCFDWLPFGVLVGGKILIIHGGIGKGQWTLQDLEQVQRPMTGQDLHKNNMVYNILWSDPIADDVIGAETFGIHDSPRDNHANEIVTQPAFVSVVARLRAVGCRSVCAHALRWHAVRKRPS